MPALINKDGIWHIVENQRIGGKLVRTYLKSLGRVSKNDARDELAYFKRDVGRARSGRLTVKDLFEEYLELVRESRTQGAIDHHQYVLAQIDPHIGHIELRNLEYQHIEFLKGKIKKPGSTADREYIRGKRTINIILGVLSRVLKYGQKSGKISSPPIIDRVSEVKQTIVTRLTAEQVATLIEATRGDVFFSQRLYITIMLGTGMRPAEFDTLDWADVDLPKRVIKIRTQRSNKLGRSIPISDDLMEFLLPLARKDGRVSPYPVEGYKNPIKRLSTRTRIKFTAYTLRKTFASVMVESGVAPFELGKLMGHSNIATTYKYYTDLQHLTLKDAMNKNPLLKPVGTQSGTQSGSKTNKTG